MLNAISRFSLRLAMVAVALSLSACGYNTIPTLEEQAKALVGRAKPISAPSRSDSQSCCDRAGLCRAGEKCSYLSHRSARQGNTGQGRGVDPAFIA